MPEVTFGPFTGGLNERIDSQFLGIQHATVARNCRMDTGSVVPVRGVKYEPMGFAEKSGGGVSLYKLNLESFTFSSLPTWVTVAGTMQRGIYYYLFTRIAPDGTETSTSGTGGLVLNLINFSDRGVKVTIPKGSIPTDYGVRLYRASIDMGGKYHSYREVYSGTFPSGVNTLTYTDNTAHGGSSTNRRLSNGWVSASSFSGVEDSEILYYAGNRTNGGWDLKIGIQPITAAPTLALNGAGVLNGTYQYVYTYLDSTGFEGAPSPVSSEIVATNQKVNVTVTCLSGTYSHSVTTIRVYRTGGTGEFQLVGEVANNIAGGTVALTDNTSDIELGETLVTDNYTPPPSNSLALCAHSGRLWFSAGDKLYFSEAGEFNAVPATNFIDFPETVVAAASMGGDLLVLTSSAEWLVVGDDVSNFQRSPTGSQYGCLSASSVATWENGVVWASRSGIVQASPGSIQVISGALSEDRFRPKILDNGFSNLTLMQAVIVNGHYWLGVVDAILHPGKYFFLVGDLRNLSSPLWREEFYHEFGYTYGAIQSDPMSGRLYLVSQTPHMATSSAMITEVDADGGVFGTMEFQTGDWHGDGDLYRQLKHFRLLRLDLELIQNRHSYKYWSYEISGGTAPVVTGPEGATVKVIVDGVVVHTITFATPTDTVRDYYRLPPGIRGKSIQLSFSGAFKLHGASVDYELVRRP